MVGLARTSLAMLPLLLAVQIYQWAVLNNGLHDIVNNPNITIFDFFRALLHQANF